MVDDTTSHSNLTLREHLTAALLTYDPQLAERLDHDPQAHLGLVALTRSARAESDVMLTEAARSARSAGCTWEQIADVLGISRQAAQQRFGQPGDRDAQPGTPSGTGTRLVLSPLTAFTEMAVLARAGTYGWHSVDYGVLFHTVERDTVQWEHRRTLRGRRPSGVGWQAVGAGWAWWTYWARPVDAAALAGDPTVEELVQG